MTDNTDLKKPVNTFLRFPAGVEILSDESAPATPLALFAQRDPTASNLSPADGNDLAAYINPATFLTEQEAQRIARVELARQIAEEGKSVDTLNLFVHLPPDATLKQPLRVLVALHGVGARGDVFANRLIADADRNGWLLIAPTINYRDHMDMKILMEEDLRYAKLLNDALSALPSRLGIRLRQHTLVYGFSRGGQLAHRFALLYPERVESVVSISAGTYTLPIEKRVSQSVTQNLPMPFGIGDFSQVVGHAFDSKHFNQISFWVAVGDADTRTSDVPRAFDDYGGRNRVQRAYMFQETLKQIGVDARIAVFQGVGHEISGEMQKGALKFLRDDELFDKLND
ncbi:MAG: hypothetical protein HY257_03360 [Chloroflexi bacterium]|nr:hypothetical protein [Chloroflexota bacterium]